MGALLEQSPATRRVRAVRWVGLTVFGLLSYVPVLATAPGRVIADTKSYLTLDPSRFLSGAGSLWDPHIGLGTVSHQTVGYLFPMGPFFWVFQELLGVPSWVTQRLWLGTLILLAGLGMRYLLRTMGVRGAGVPVGMLAYAFTPYVLQYSSRLSVLLSPWAGLGWMMAFVMRGLRARPWKYAALLAITVQLVGSVNAPALLYALVGPTLWIPYAVWIRRDCDWRAAWALVWRTGLLTLATSAWWLAGLLVQADYGLSILRFTESIQSVSATSTVTEILRGLGYWFFYGGDRGGRWNDAILELNRQPLGVLVSFAIPVAALIGAALIRWRDRAFFAFMALVSVTIAVAASPYDDPTLLGRLIKAFSTGSTLGLALRSTSRAVPLMVLSFSAILAVAVSAGVSALSARGLRPLGIGVAGLLAVLCLAGSPGVWHGRYYSEYLERPEEVPTYWQEALAALDQRSHDTRVLALPGSDFAAYRWGDTIDPMEPGLMERDYVARELVPWGSEASANLLIALDRRLQSSTLDPDAVAPIARLMAAGDVLLRFDLDTSRYALITARVLWDTFNKRPAAGLEEPETFGTEIPGKLRYPELGDLARPAKPDPVPVAVLGVQDPLPIVRSKSTADPLVVAGDGEGLVDLAAAGLLDANRAVLYSGTFARAPRRLAEAVGDRGVLVVTDSNRRRGMRWAGMTGTYGYTEQAGEKPLRRDLLDQRLELFPGATDATRTVTELRGLDTIAATAYGTSSFGYAPDPRPASAIDGRLLSSWEVASGFSTVGPERLRIELDHPITTDRVHLVQPFTGGRGRWITRVKLRFDDDQQVVRDLHRSSRGRDGEDIEFGTRTFSTLEIQIDDTVANRRGSTPTERGRLRKTGVGFAEVGLRDAADGNRPVRAVEVIRMPRDLLRNLGEASQEHPLAFVMTRNEPDLRRSLALPTQRAFTVGGSMVLSQNTADEVVDERLGIPSAEQGGISVSSSTSIGVGDPVARASAALDGDPETVWQTRGRKIRGQSVEVDLASPTTVDHADLQIRSDGRHSIPTQIRIETATASRTIDLPPIPIDNGGVTRVPVRFEPLTGDFFRVAVTDFEPLERQSGNWGTFVTLPVAIAELGLPGVTFPPPPAEMPDRCWDDLLEIDGEPFPIRITGSTADALDGRPLRFEACDPAATVTLAAGSHEVYGRASRKTGLDFNRVVLSSGAGGVAAAPEQVLMSAGAEARRPARTRVIEAGRTSLTVELSDLTAPTWLVLGQSQNDGWRASVDGHDLGPSTLVDGYANGWRIEPRRNGAPVRVRLVWTPQQRMRIAYVVSALGALVCLAILILGSWRRRRRPARDEAPLTDAPWIGRIVNPFSAAGRTPSRRVVAATTIAAGVAGSVLVRPWCGLLVGALVLAALVSDRWRGVLRCVPWVVALTIALWVSWGQARHNYPPSFDWPVYFERLRTAAWLVVVLLAADGIVGLVKGADRDPPVDRAPEAGGPATA